MLWAVLILRILLPLSECCDGRGYATKPGSILSLPAHLDASSAYFKAPSPLLNTLLYALTPSLIAQA